MLPLATGHLARKEETKSQRYMCRKVIINYVRSYSETFPPIDQDIMVTTRIRNYRICIIIFDAIEAIIETPTSVYLVRIDSAALFGLISSYEVGGVG